MKRRILLFSLLASLLALGQAAPARAQSSDVMMPGSFTVVPNLAGCPAETITAYGQIHLVSTTVNGVPHINLVDFHGSAVGASGTSYQVSTLLLTTSNGNPDPAGPGPGESTDLGLDLLAISGGSAPNLIIHSVFHITVDANGNTTALVLVGSTECRG